jgi:hypothetical protein
MCISDASVGSKRSQINAFNFVARTNTAARASAWATNLQGCIGSNIQSGFEKLLERQYQ